MGVPFVMVVGDGYLGKRLAGSVLHAYLNPGRIANVHEALGLIRAQPRLPDAIINCIKQRGRKTWEENPFVALESNLTVPLALAEACRLAGTFLIHLSTDCVFAGPKPGNSLWTEADMPQPLTFYGRCKAAADLALMGFDHVAIVRFRSPIDHIPSSQNFLDRLASYSEVADIRYSVTFMEDLITAIQAIAETRRPGVYHVFNPGEFSHREFLLRYQAHVDQRHACSWVIPNEGVGTCLTGGDRFFAPSRRLEELGVVLRPVEEATEDTLVKYAANKRALQR